MRRIEAWFREAGCFKPDARSWSAVRLASCVDGLPAANTDRQAAMVSMLLRGYRPSDLDTLHAIDQSCFPPGVSYSREELAAFISHRNSKAWIAQSGEEIVGFLVAGRAPEGIGHIITIDVVEAWRRRAVGTALMDAAEEWARKQSLRLVYLETAEDNLAAQAFYRKRGYRLLKKLERYYGNGAAAWVMAKWL